MSAKAKIRAKELLEKYCIENPKELNLEEIANAEYIIIQEKKLERYDGRLSNRNKIGIITINKNIREKTQKIFTIAHELGHFYLGTGIRNICSREDILNYHTKQNIEREANIFASELLMPENWFRDNITWQQDGIKTIKSVSEFFNVSLSAAAMRYTEIGEIPISIIISQKSRVIWSSTNEYFPLKYIKPGQAINSYSYAYDYFHDKEITSQPHEILTDAWFLNDFNYKPGIYIIEQNFILRNYKAVMTILWEGDLNEF
jgi:Zn-dependent peptidase ImmA (M78 family)